ncbi:hypothetical protein [Lentzea sp.]|uniref:hypothetical protein n=1 Tax=Lentzea sp. TaxID=56099 RepID=UPI002ED08F33
MRIGPIMEDGSPPSRKKAARWTAAVVAALAVLGFAADVTGLIGFFGGKTFPELAAPSSSQPTAGPGTSAPVVTTAQDPPSTPPAPPATRRTGTAPEPDRQDVPAGNGPVVTTTDAVKNFQLGVSPGEFAAATPRTVVIETWEGGLGTFVDVEIADPAASGGVCPKLTTGPCNLVYSGGSEADGTGRSRTDFEWFGDAPGHDGIHHPGRYTVTVQDRGTGVKLSIDFTAR